MQGRLLKLSPLHAGSARVSWHIYYGAYYVGIINPAGERWRVWLNGVTLGEFGSLDEAKRAVAEWYYGPGAGG